MNNLKRYLTLSFLLFFAFYLHPIDGKDGKRKREKFEEYATRSYRKEIPIILYQLKLENDALLSKIEGTASASIESDDNDWYIYVSNDTIAICAGPCAHTLCKDAHQLGYVMVNDVPLVVVSKCLFPESISFENAVEPLAFPFVASYESINDSLAPTKCILISPSQP